MVVGNTFSLHSPFLSPSSMNGFLSYFIPLTGPDLHPGAGFWQRNVIFLLTEDLFQIPVSSQKGKYAQFPVSPSGPSFSAALSGSLRPPRTFYHPRRKIRFAGQIFFSFFFSFLFFPRGPSSHDNTALMKFTF